MAIEIEMIEMS